MVKSWRQLRASPSHTSEVEGRRNCPTSFPSSSRNTLFMSESNHVHSNFFVVSIFSGPLVQYRTTLHCTARHHTALHRSAPHHTAPYRTTLHHTACTALQYSREAAYDKHKDENAVTQPNVSLVKRSASFPFLSHHGTISVTNDDST